MALTTVAFISSGFYFRKNVRPVKTKFGSVDLLLTVDALPLPTVKARGFLVCPVFSADVLVVVVVAAYDGSGVLDGELEIGDTIVTSLVIRFIVI